MIFHHGFVMLDRGCFDSILRSRSKVRLLIDHDDTQCVGSTDDGLDLYADQHGLAFRFRLSDTALGRVVREMAELGNDCMSIGFDRQNARTEYRSIKGVACTDVILSATLFEVSLMHGKNAGMVRDAFATVKNVDFNESLRDQVNGGKYLYEGAAINVKRALEKYASAIAD
jgi:HK97 family phage prohead protease